MPRSAATLLWASLLLVGSPDAPGNPRDDAIKKELKAMAGTWRPVSAENNGFKASADDLKGTRWVRDADGKWAFQRDGKTVLEWSARSLDPTATPKSIDIEVASGMYMGAVYLGIYELDGDTLRICFAMPDRPVRPTEFSAGKGSVRALSEFKREKNEKLMTGRVGARNDDCVRSRWR